jgi:hypothetical protein
MPPDRESFAVTARSSIRDSIAHSLASEFEQMLFSLGALACSTL